MERKIIVEINPFGFGENNQYHFNAQIWNYVSGQWWYAGDGKYCENLEELLQYTQSKNLPIEFR